MESDVQEVLMKIYELWREMKAKRRQIYHMSEELEKIKRQIKDTRGSTSEILNDLQKTKGQIDEEFTNIHKIKEEIEKVRETEREGWFQDMIRNSKDDMAGIPETSTNTEGIMKQINEASRELERLKIEGDVIQMDLKCKQTGQANRDIQEPVSQTGTPGQANRDIQEPVSQTGTNRVDNEQSENINEDLGNSGKWRRKRTLGEDVESDSRKVSRSTEKVTTETSEVPRETPAVPCESPEIPCESPGVPCESPEVPCESPEVPCESPEVSLESPEEPWESPGVSLESPERSWETPEVPWKITDVETELKVLTETPVSPGSVIKCRLCVLKPAHCIIRINFLQVTFLGKSRFAHSRKMKGSLARGMMGDLSNSYLTHTSKGCKDKYTAWERTFLSKAQRPVVLEREGEPGGDSFEPIVFEMKVPENIPDSWDGDVHGKIEYFLVTKLHYMELDTERDEVIGRQLSAEDICLKSKTELRVRRNLHANEIGFDETEETMITRELPNRPGIRGGRLEVQFWVASRATVPGGSIVGNVLINNYSERKIMKIKVTLYQVYTLTTGGTYTRPTVQTVKLKLDKVKLNGFTNRRRRQVQCQLFMPNNVPSQASFIDCSIIDVHYYVRFYVKWRFDSLEHRFNIMVATTGLKDAATDIENPTPRSLQEEHRSRLPLPASRSSRQREQTLQSLGGAVRSRESGQEHRLETPISESGHGPMTATSSSSGKRLDASTPRGYHGSRRPAGDGEGSRSEAQNLRGPGGSNNPISGTSERDEVSEQGQQSPSGPRETTSSNRREYNLMDTQSPSLLPWM